MAVDIRGNIRIDRNGCQAATFKSPDGRPVRLLLSPSFFYFNPPADG